jgi:signal peptidase I
VLAVVGLKTFVARAFYIPSVSMVPQLRVNDRVVVSRLAYRIHPPRRGDIVVFSAPASEQGNAGDRSHNPLVSAARSAGQAIGVVESHTELVKRVIALPGETVQGRNGQVFIGDALLVEPYLVAGTVTSPFGPVAIPQGWLWVMGDNRANSGDSRVFGPIRTSSVVGRTIWRIWPISHLSFL